VSTSEAILLRRITRERAARAAAERLLEEKSLELYELNQELRSWNESLEEIVRDRTAELTKALEATQEANQQMEHQALHDPLTGLPNRRYLKRLLQNLSGGLQREKGSGVAVFHIDLDRFKQINDTRGHAAGDFVLTYVASVLRSMIRSEDFVARIGGDEFVIVAQSDGNPQSLSALADRIVAAFDKPILYGKQLCRFGASVGIAYSRARNGDLSKLLVNADIALYRAKNKSRGGGGFAFFSSALQREIAETRKMADDILNGLDANEFFPVYQPQFDANSFAILGIETLVRWRHREKGILPPVKFLKIAEDLRVIDQIDKAMLEQSLRDMKMFQASGLNIPRVSVNMSLWRLGDMDLINGLADLNLPKGLVSFELIESVFLDDTHQATPVSRTIRQLKQLGIDVEIDDFGTGHASIVGLLRVNPTRLKIAHELVMPITRSRPQRRLVQSIIEMGKALGIGIVAEGVETAEHARILRDLGCDALQGYAFGRPMDAEALLHFLKQRSEGSAPDI
jgi:diguanylate cyclase (GGDEF)-like protein